MGKLGVGLNLIVALVVVCTESCLLLPVEQGLFQYLLPCRQLLDQPPRLSKDDPDDDQECVKQSS